MAMHVCLETQEKLVDLLFGEVDAEVAGQRLLVESEECPACQSHYRSMVQTLRIFDKAVEAVSPAENFWTGYEERLSKRMAQEIQLNFWPEKTPAAVSLSRRDYSLTILEDTGLARRLTDELKAVARASELTWPEFKRDPFGFTGRMVAGYGQLAGRFLAREHTAPALMAPLCLLLFIGSVWMAVANRCLFMSHFGGRCEQFFADRRNDDLQLVGWVNSNIIPKEQATPETGAAGLSGGKGGGSQQNHARPGGGGGGGNLNPHPVSMGKVAPGRMEDQIIAPNVRQPTVKNPELAVSPSLKGDPLLLPEDPRQIPFGDPKSVSQIPSDGSGTGGGQGTGDGSGQGAGQGKGYGSGRGENTGGNDTAYGCCGPGGTGGGTPENYGRVFRRDEVTRKAVIISRPEPGFTEEARKNGVTGLVSLRVVLGASGTVTSVSVIQGLPDGLTERAITAAKSIKFQPAQKDGRNVSQYIALEYNFNIY